MIGGAVYLTLACLSVVLTQDGSEPVSAIWVSNAAAIAILLRARLRSELPFLLACFAASLIANGVARLPDSTALLFSVANLTEIVVVLALSRAGGRATPDMSRLADLARFVWAGGLVAPLASAVLAVPAMGVSFAEWRAGGWRGSSPTAWRWS